MPTPDATQHDTPTGQILRTYRDESNDMERTVVSKIVSDTTELHDRIVHGS